MARAGLLTNKVYADNSRISYAYTSDGRLSRKTWARGAWVSYAYDDLGQVTNTAYSDDTPAVAQTYNAAGLLSDVSDDSVRGTATPTTIGRPVTMRPSHVRIASRLSAGHWTTASVTWRRLPLSALRTLRRLLTPTTTKVGSPPRPATTRKAGASKSHSRMKTAVRSATRRLFRTADFRANAGARPAPSRTCYRLHQRVQRDRLKGLRVRLDALSAPRTAMTTLSPTTRAVNSPARFCSPTVTATSTTP
jgi:YD repeat-containing protein